VLHKVSFETLDAVFHNVAHKETLRGVVRFHRFARGILAQPCAVFVLMDFD
jgi:hypothetical protein